MDLTSTPQTDSQTSPDKDAPVDPLDQLASLAEQAAQNPQTSAPVRELLPLLVAELRRQAEILILLGA